MGGGGGVGTVRGVPRWSREHHPAKSSLSPGPHTQISCSFYANAAARAAENLGLGIVFLIVLVAVGACGFPKEPDFSALKHNRRVAGRII